MMRMRIQRVNSCTQYNTIITYVINYVGILDAVCHNVDLMKRLAIKTYFWLVYERVGALDMYH